MELVFTFLFLFLWITTTIFLLLWVRYLVKKIRIIAEKRQERLDILNQYLDGISDILQSEMWFGDPMFKSHKDYTERLIRYLQDDSLEDEIKFIYEKQ